MSRAIFPPRRWVRSDQLLLPLAQHPPSKIFLIVRREAGAQPMKVTAALENAVRALGPDVDRTLTYGDGAAYSRIVTGVWLRQNSVQNFLVQWPSKASLAASS